MACYTVPQVQQLLPIEFPLYPQVRLLQTQKHFSEISFYDYVVLLRERL